KYYESLLKKNNVQILHYNDEFNFSAQCNLGVDYANGEYIILLNNDTEVITDNWIEKLLGPCMRDDVGIVGPKLLFADGTVQHGGILVHRSHPCHYNYGLGRFDPGYYNTAVLPMDVSGVTAACLMSTKDLYKKVGGFDTTFPTNFNDVDFCLKVRETGLNILYYPYVEMYHFESRTRENEEESLEGILKINKAYNLLRQRYPRYFAIGDPFYNPRFKNENCYFMI
ncbi:MAG: glycosyltransferase, partial [Coriobacteriales bacterium]|nr:glycosyltransferase [Coriobacteriales bacterium]